MNLEALVADALQETDDDRWWAIIHQIVALDRAVVFAEGLRLVTSAQSKTRAVGAALLGRIDYNGLGPEARAEAVDALESLSRGSDSPVAVVAICSLGHLQENRAIPCVVSLAAHRDPEVRWAVASTLPMLCDSTNDYLVVPYVLELTRDADPHVREWATFGIGTQLEDVDSEVVRTVLAERLKDENEDVRAEALIGLARRKDERAVAAILQAVAAGDPSSYHLDAAGHLDDPNVYEALLHRLGEWKEEWPFADEHE